MLSASIFKALSRSCDHLINAFPESFFSFSEECSCCDSWTCLRSHVHTDFVTGLLIALGDARGYCGAFINPVSVCD